MHTVKVIRQEGLVALVEWMADGLTKRAIVPAGVVVNGQVEAQHLAYGIPFGHNLAELMTVDYSALVAEELHRRGIWTCQDVLARPEEARSACVAMAAQVLAELLRESKRTVNSNGE